MSPTAAQHAYPRHRFPGLNGIRALGALFVLTTHVGFHSGAALNTTFNGLLSRLDVGVAIFFVISGFLLFRPHAEGWATGNPRPATRRYLWHRALRILPALWLAVVGAVLLLQRPDEPVSDYVRHATLTHVYSPGHEAQGLTQMWSLATEMAFYLVLPVLAWALTRGPVTIRALHTRLAMLLTTPALGAVWMASSAANTEDQRALWLPGYIGWFGLGMALALWQTGRATGILYHSWLDDVARHPGTVWGLAGTIYLVVVSPVAGPYSLVQATPGEAAVKNLLYALLGALVVFPAIAGHSSAEDPPAVRRLGGRTATFFGDISYGVFCYHLIVLGVIEELMAYTIFTGGFVRLYLPTLAATVVVATLSYFCVERPIMRRGRRGERREVSGAPRTLEGRTTAHAATATSTST